LAFCVLLALCLHRPGHTTREHMTTARLPPPAHNRPTRCVCGVLRERGGIEGAAAGNAHRAGLGIT
jgi:hypothetical protein